MNAAGDEHILKDNLEYIAFQDNTSIESKTGDSAPSSSSTNETCSLDHADHACVCKTPVIVQTDLGATAPFCLNHTPLNLNYFEGENQVIIQQLCPSAKENKQILTSIHQSKTDYILEPPYEALDVDAEIGVQIRKKKFQENDFFQKFMSQKKSPKYKDYFWTVDAISKAQKQLKNQQTNEGLIDEESHKCTIVSSTFKTDKPWEKDADLAAAQIRKKKFQENEYFQRFMSHKEGHKYKEYSWTVDAILKAQKLLRKQQTNEGLIGEKVHECTIDSPTLHEVDPEDERLGAQISLRKIQENIYFKHFMKARPQIQSQTIMFKCDICNRICKTSAGLKRHKSCCVSQTDVFPCDADEENPLQDTITNIIEGLDTTLENSKNAETTAGTNFDETSDTDHKTGGKFLCNECGLIFPNADELEFHVLLRHPCKTTNATHDHEREYLKLSEEQYKLQRKLKEQTSTLQGLRSLPARQLRQALEGSSKITVKDGKSKEQGKVATNEVDSRTSLRKDEGKKTFSKDTNRSKDNVCIEKLDSSILSKNKEVKHEIPAIDVNRSCIVKLVNIESTLGRNEFKTKSLESENIISKGKVEGSKPYFTKSVDRILMTREKGKTFSKEQLMKKFGIKDVSVKIWKTPHHNIKLGSQSLTGQTFCDVYRSTPEKVTQSNLKRLGQMDLQQRITTSIGGLTARTDSSTKDKSVSLQEITDNSIQPDESLDRISSRSHCSGMTDDEKSIRSVSPQPSTSSGFIYIPRKRTARKTIKDKDLKKQYSLKEARVLLKSLTKIELALLKNPHSHFGKGHQSGQDSDDGEEQNVSLTSLLEDVDYIETDINEDNNNRDKGKALSKKGKSLSKSKPQLYPSAQQSNTVDADLLKKFGITQSIVVIKQIKPADNKLVTDFEVPTKTDKRFDLPSKDDAVNASKRERGVITIVVGKGSNPKQTKQTSPEKDNAPPSCNSNTGLTPSCSSNDGALCSTKEQSIGISPRANRNRNDTNVSESSLNKKTLNSKINTVICKPFSILLAPIDIPKKKTTISKVFPNDSENMHHDNASMDCKSHSEPEENGKDKVSINSDRPIELNAPEHYRRNAKRLNKNITNRGESAEGGQKNIEVINESITKGESDASKLVLNISNSESGESIKQSDTVKVYLKGIDPNVFTQDALDGEFASQKDNATTGSCFTINSDKMEVEFENQSKLKVNNVGEKNDAFGSHAHVNEPSPSTTISNQQTAVKRPAPETVNSDQSQKKQKTSFQRDATDPSSSDNSKDFKVNYFTSFAKDGHDYTSHHKDKVGVTLTEPEKVDKSVSEMKDADACDDMMDTVNVLSKSMDPCADSSCSTQGDTILFGDKDPFECFEDTMPELKGELNDGGQPYPVNVSDLDLDSMENQHTDIQESVQHSDRVRDSDEQSTDIRDILQNSVQVRDSCDKQPDIQESFQHSNKVRDSGDQHTDMQESVLYSDQVRDSGDTIAGDAYCSDNTDASCFVPKMPSPNETIEIFNEEDSAVNKDTFLDDIIEPREDEHSNDMSPRLILSQGSVQSIQVIDNMSETAIGDICIHENQNSE